MRPVADAATGGAAVGGGAAGAEAIGVGIAGTLGEADGAGGEDSGTTIGVA